MGAPLPKMCFALSASSSTNTCAISPSLPRQKTPIGMLGKPLSGERELHLQPCIGAAAPVRTLGAGIVWMAIPLSSKGGITVSSTVMNTQDSSTTTGFDDFDEGTFWSTEADFQYRLGHHADFRQAQQPVGAQPGQGLVVPKEKSTWAVYWST